MGNLTLRQVFNFALGHCRRPQAAVTTLHDQLVEERAARTFWRRASLRSAMSAIVLLPEQITPLSCQPRLRPAADPRLPWVSREPKHTVHYTEARKTGDTRIFKCFEAYELPFRRPVTWAGN